MRFVDLGLSEPIVRAVTSEGYIDATPVQGQAIPRVLEGRDVLGVAQTGTGKTAAFALPILHRLTATRGQQPAGTRSRVLVLCPTRELASQIADSFRTYGKNLGVRVAVIFGGVNQNPQAQALRRGVDVVIATPGRLLDLMNQGLADLRGIEVLVLDEADRMLDMGFIHDIRRIVAKLPAARQTLMFSATMPPEIRSLADSLLRKPAVVQVTPVSSTVDGVAQSVYFVEKRNKPLLLAHLVNDLPMSRAIVFTRTKHGADRVVRHLHQRGIRAEAIHGNKSQNARERAMDNFRANKIGVLVATDIAARGIDIDGITHVVNYDLTHEPETYVHRIGRTARAGATGAAIAFCDGEERENLRAIEKLIRRSIPVRTDHPEYPRGEQRPAFAGSAEVARDRQHHRAAAHAPSSRAGRSQHPAGQPRQSHAAAQPVGAGVTHGTPSTHHQAPRPRHPLGNKPGVHRGAARRPGGRRRPF